MPHKPWKLVVSSQFDTAGSPAAVSGTQPPVVPFWVTEIRDSTCRIRSAIVVQIRDRKPERKLPLLVYSRALLF